MWFDILLIAVVLIFFVWIMYGLRFKRNAHLPHKQGYDIRRCRYCGGRIRGGATAGDYCVDCGEVNA